MNEICACGHSILDHDSGGCYNLGCPCQCFNDSKERLNGGLIYMKKCYKCGTTEKECPDFYKTKDSEEDICGDCYGIAS